MRTTICGYEVHPACELLPMMSASALEEMAEDIRDHGQRQPIWLLEGRILDGRNRLKACELAGVAPEIREWEGDDPIRWVLSLNFHRRHLSDDQKGVVGARAAHLLMQRALASVRPPAGSTPHRPAPPEDGASPQAEPEPDQKEMARRAERTAATLVNISPQRVARGRKLIERAAPSLVGAVERGEVTMSQAHKVAALEPAAQDALVQRGGAALAEELRRMQAQRSAARPSFGRALSELDDVCAEWTCSRDLEGDYRFDGLTAGVALSAQAGSYKGVILEAWTELQRLQPPTADSEPSGGS